MGIHVAIHTPSLELRGNMTYNQAKSKAQQTANFVRVRTVVLVDLTDSSLVIYAACLEQSAERIIAFAEARGRMWRIDEVIEPEGQDNA